MSHTFENSGRGVTLVGTLPFQLIRLQDGLCCDPVGRYSQETYPVQVSFRGIFCARDINAPFLVFGPLSILPIQPEVWITGRI